MLNHSFHIKRIYILLILFSVNINSYTQHYWQEIIDPDTMPITTMLPMNYDTIILGTGSNHPYIKGGIYRSINGGNTWEFTGIDAWTIYDLISLGVDTLYAATSSGIYMTKNFGDDWEHILPFMQNVICLCKVSSGVLFAGFWGGIMRSFDYGITWDTSLVMSGVINSILPISESEIYVACTDYSSPGGGGVFISDDLGNSWGNIGLNGYDAQSLAYNSNQELFVGCVYYGLYKTVDQGVTWDTVLPWRDIFSVIIKENDNMFIGCSRHNFPIGGVFFSNNNGETWEDYTYNIMNNDIKQLEITDDNYFYARSSDGSSLGPPLYRSINPLFVNVNEIIQDYEFFIYPNPASTNLNVLMLSRSNEKEIQNILVYDLQGKLIINDSGTLLPNNTLQLDVSQLKAGMYYVNIIIEEASFSEKVLIK